MQARGFEVDLFPPQVTNFRCPEAVPEGQEHHESVAMTIAIVLAAPISRSTSSMVRYSRVRMSPFLGRRGR
jgi:hypothetical protein